jgi:hypothetical protein
MGLSSKYLPSQPHRRGLIAFFALFISWMLSPLSFAATLTIPADANIFGAGHSSPPAPGGGGAGELPPEFDFGFTAGTGLVLIFTSVTGSVTVDNGSGNHFNDPDGVGSASGIDVNSFGGISGIVANTAGFLAGVFLGPSEPSDPATLRLDFTMIGTSFTSLSPQLDQVFFIGDGLTGDGTGTIQQFNVPTGATRLVLGLVDAPNYNGDPGGYGDNTGSFSATFSIPEPSVSELLFGGVGLLVLVGRRIRAVRD